MFSAEINQRIRDIKRQNLNSIALMGSYARTQAKKFSDIDIVCFLKEHVRKLPTQMEIVDKTYIVISFYTPKDLETWFSNPEKATEYISGLRSAKTIWDPQGFLDDLRKRALSFKWNNTLQIKANEYASKELVSWIEEVHKALSGLLLDDIGRMLNGLFGLTFGIFKVVRVQQGILLTSENSFFQQVIDHFGEESPLAIISKQAFGIDNTLGIRERVVAGLKLFDYVTDMFIDILREDAIEAVLFVKDEIRRELNLIR